MKTICEISSKLTTSNNNHDWSPVKYLNVLHHNRTESSCDNFFLIYCKNITNFLFSVFWKRLATSIKKDNTNLEKFWRLSACQNWPPLLTSLLRYCKDISNLLLWVIENAWSCPLIMIISTLQETLIPSFEINLSACKKINFICIQKIKFIFNFFFEILWRDCKLPILATLGRLDHSHQNHAINF